MRAPIIVAYASAYTLALALAACGPATTMSDDGGDDQQECSGDAERCLGNLHQQCNDDGVFETVEACDGACNLDFGGCVACDPEIGQGCDGNTVVTCNSDGTLGDPIETCGTGETCQNGECTRDCAADGVDLVYVVDETYRLLSFDPLKLGTSEDPFTLIGNLSCPAAAQPVPGWVGGVTPFSMSVDRNGVAWVLYTSGEIFHVSTANAQCTASSFVPQQMGGEWALFGMGFVTDEADGDTERLYIGGGDPTATPGGLFGVVDPATLAVMTRGNLPATGEYSPEFTGTGAAELFGFFPGAGSAFVQELDKATGAAVGSPMNITGGLGGTVSAWAFAQWGGKFYIFVTTTDIITTNSTVRVIDRATGAYEGAVLQNLPYVIVGAGVSTCAPVVVE
jgi:hypothetical protein